MPVACELFGLLPRTWWIANGTLVSTSEIVRIHGNRDAIAVVLANAGWIAIIANYAVNTNRRRRDLQRQLHIQRWHLQQTIPDPQLPKARRTKV